MSSHKKSIYIFILAGLAICVALVLMVAPWASSSPDGLEKVAEDKGFINQAEQTDPAWNSSPVPDYAMPGVEENHPALATALAGLAGTVAIFLIAWGLALVLKKKGSEGKTDLESALPNQDERRFSG
jgi:cobalt/nickel transport protein